MSSKDSLSGKASSLSDDAYAMTEMMRAYRISRSRLYAEIRSGRLRVMKVGTRTLVTAQARREWEHACSQLPLCNPIKKKPRATDAR